MKNESNERDHAECNEKVIPERDRMGLVQALNILHGYHDFLKLGDPEDLVVISLEVIFEWIDNMVLLLKKLPGSAASSSSVEEKEN